MHAPVRPSHTTHCMFAETTMTCCGGQYAVSGAFPAA
jgi:hypothetical protein